MTSGTISEEDFDYITVTDNIDEIVTIMVEHRQWKNRVRGIPEDVHDSVIK